MPSEIIKKRKKGSVRCDESKTVIANYVFDYPFCGTPSDEFREELVSSLEKYAVEKSAQMIKAEAGKEGFVPYSLFLEYTDHGGGGEVEASFSYIFSVMRGNTLIFAHSFCENRNERGELLTLRSLCSKSGRGNRRNRDFIVRGSKVFLYSFDASAYYGRRIRRSALSSLAKIEPV